MERHELDRAKADAGTVGARPGCAWDALAQGSDNTSCPLPIADTLGHGSPEHLDDTWVRMAAVKLLFR